VRILMLSLLLSLTLSEKPWTAQISKPTETWKRIELLRSTRTEVEKLVGESKSKAYVVTYPVDGGDLDVEYYSFDRCKPRYGYDGFLDIPEWTVIEFTYIPDNPPQFATLKLDLRKFRKVRESPHVPDMISYVNDEEGIDYTFEGDGTTLQSIRYFSAKRFDKVRCLRHSASTR
jgi:hypothetical protein